MQALIYTTLWRPVDPEVEDQLAQETTVVRAFGEHGGKVRPLCGYGLLQAKEEARKVRALQSLMRVRIKTNLDGKLSPEASHVLLIIYYIFSVALCVPAVISIAGADGELPGQRRAEAGQAAALRCQTSSTHSTLRRP